VESGQLGFRKREFQVGEARKFVRSPDIARTIAYLRSDDCRAAPGLVQMGGPHLSGKTMVIGAITRKGNVVCQMIEEAGFNTLENFVKETVSKKVTLVATDENFRYRHLGAHGFVHKTVNHSQHQYVIGSTHTNTIEGFWSLLKRGIVGSYHKVSKDYLPLYLNEFAFRYNHRNDPDIFRALLSRV
jgi:transposase-like protein